MNVDFSYPSSSEPPHPYRSDGGFNARGVANLLLIGFACAVILGVVQGFFSSKGFNFLVISPIMIGIGLGFLLGNWVHKGKIRNWVISAWFGVTLGLIVVITIHYFQFWLFERSLDQVPTGARIVARNFDHFRATRAEQPPEVQQLLHDFEKNPAARESFAVDGFFSHLDLMARRGLRVNNSREQNREPGNMGYRGTYVYWGIEALLIFAVACGCAVSPAFEPFCTECDCWKVPQAVGYVIGKPEQVKQALAAGDLSMFDPSRSIEPKSSFLLAHLMVCPHCNSPGHIEIRLNFLIFRQGKKGQSTTQMGRTLTTVTYPRDAAVAFVNLIRLPRPQQLADSTQISGNPQAGSIFGMFGFIFISFALIVLAGATYVVVLSRRFSPIGFAISGVIALCGGGLLWIAARKRRRQ